MSVLEGVLADLRAEGEELEKLVIGADWTTQTPAPGWTVAHQIAHLAWTDEMSLLAVTDPEGFAQEVVTAAGKLESYIDDGAADGARMPQAELLERWRTSRAQLEAALRNVPSGEKIGWYGATMGATAMASARIMETWAHGQDVADALGVVRPATNRLSHIARFAVRTRDHAFSINGRTPPAEPFRVELTAPDGSVWEYGPPDAGNRVTGPALDLCLVAVQRRNRADTALVAVGADADAWLDIAQTFAGPPGQRREPSATS